MGDAADGPKLDLRAILTYMNNANDPFQNVFGNTYIGQTHIATEGSDDTLELSLGSDRKVNITRVKKEDYNSKSLAGLYKVEKFTYEIDVRNNNSVPVSLELIDQIPIAQDSGARSQASCGRSPARL